MCARATEGGRLGRARLPASYSLIQHFPGPSELNCHPNFRKALPLELTDFDPNDIPNEKEGERRTSQAFFVFHI